MTEASGATYVSMVPLIIGVPLRAHGAGYRIFTWKIRASWKNRWIPVHPNFRVTRIFHDLLL